MWVGFDVIWKLHIEERIIEYSTIEERNTEYEIFPTSNSLMNGHSSNQYIRTRQLKSGNAFT